MRYSRSICRLSVRTASSNCSSVEFMSLLQASRLPGEAWYYNCSTYAGAWSEPDEQRIADRKTVRTLATTAFRRAATYHHIIGRRSVELVDSPDIFVPCRLGRAAGLNGVRDGSEWPRRSRHLVAPSQ